MPEAGATVQPAPAVAAPLQVLATATAQIAATAAMAARCRRAH